MVDHKNLQSFSRHFKSAMQRLVAFCCMIADSTKYVSKQTGLDWTVAEYSWFIANNFVIGVYCRCLEILCQIAFSSISNYFRFYRKK